MKTFTKHNRYGTISLSIDDADNAAIFDTCNDAIFWLLSSGLVINEPASVDFDFFVNAFKSHTNDDGSFIRYSVFNFGAKAAIYAEEFESCGEGDLTEIVSRKFMTKKFSNSIDFDVAE